MGTLYYGDSFDILMRYVKDVTAAANQIHAFEDTWHWDIETKKASTP